MLVPVLVFVLVSGSAAIETDIAANFGKRVSKN